MRSVNTDNQLNPMIEFKNVDKTYAGAAVQALADINLTVSQGEICGVIGESGAGKSTLIRIVNGLEKVNSGQVLVDGQDITTLSTTELLATRRKIGMIFQHFNLLSSRTVYDNIAFPLELIKTPKDKIKKTIQPLIELTGLQDQQHKYPAQLSGGQKQRVAIARALANQPKILLCDEATSALDLNTTHAILQLLKEINEKMGLTILMITHEMEVVKEICHHLALIENGRLVESADVLAFFSNPQSEMAKKFIRRTFKHHLPQPLQMRVHGNPDKNSLPLLRLTFKGTAAEEPFITQLSQQFGVNLNILQANIEQIRDQAIGVMVVTAEQHTPIEEAIAYLQSKDIQVEVIGYVQPNN